MSAMKPIFMQFRSNFNELVVTMIRDVRIIVLSVRRIKMIDHDKSLQFQLY